MEVNTRNRQNVKILPRKSNSNIYERYIKRIMDFVLAVCETFVLFPVLLILALLVRIKIGTPIIFKQVRPGLNEELFTLYKFRTMTDERDEDGNLLPDSVRLTKFGRFLRATSLDELPELINIIKGDMSIIGPRPQLVRDMLFMTEKQRSRHSVRPGLSGLAQVNGRNNITWDEKIQYDLEYIKDINFINDVRIIITTIIKVFKKENITTEGMDTAEDLCDFLLRTGRIQRDEYNRKINESKKLVGVNQ